MRHQGPCRVQGSGPDELQHEFILGLRRVRRVLIPWIVGIAQKRPFLHQLETRRFDFLAKKGLFDPMQGTGFGYASTGSARMVGDDVEPSRFERAEDGPIHRRTVYTQM